MFVSTSNVSQISSEHCCCYKNSLFKGVVHNCHHFQKSTEYAGGGVRGSMATVRFFFLMLIVFSYWVVKKSTFSKYSFGRDGAQKEYSVYTFDNVDNYGLQNTTYVNINIFSKDKQYFTVWASFTHSWIYSIADAVGDSKLNKHNIKCCIVPEVPDIIFTV